MVTMTFVHARHVPCVNFIPLRGCHSQQNKALTFLAELCMGFFPGDPISLLGNPHLLPSEKQQLHSEDSKVNISREKAHARSGTATAGHGRAHRVTPTAPFPEHAPTLSLPGANGQTQMEGWPPKHVPKSVLVARDWGTIGPEKTEETQQLNGTCDPRTENGH